MLAGARSRAVASACLCAMSVRPSCAVRARGACSAVWQCEGTAQPAPARSGGRKDGRTGRAAVARTGGERAVAGRRGRRRGSGEGFAEAVAAAVEPLPVGRRRARVGAGGRAFTAGAEGRAHRQYAESTASSRAPQPAGGHAEAQRSSRSRARALRTQWARAHLSPYRPVRARCGAAWLCTALAPACSGGQTGPPLRRT